MIPKRIRAVTTDKLGFALAQVTDYKIQVVLEFEGALDADRLRHALRLLMDAEPVLGSRFVPHWFSPYWERLTEAELSRNLLKVSDSSE